MHTFNLPGAYPVHRTAGFEGYRNLGQGTIASPDRDHRIGREDNKDIPCIAQTRPDGYVKVRVAPFRAGKNAHRGPAGLFCPPARGLHDTPEPPADKHGAVLCNQTAG